MNLQQNCIYKLPTAAEFLIYTCQKFLRRASLLNLYKFMCQKLSKYTIIKFVV